MRKKRFEPERSEKYREVKNNIKGAVPGRNRGTIGLISHPSKVMLKSMLNRLKLQAVTNISSTSKTFPRSS